MVPVTSVYVLPGVCAGVEPEHAARLRHDDGCGCRNSKENAGVRGPSLGQVQTLIVVTIIRRGFVSRFIKQVIVWTRV